MIKILFSKNEDIFDVEIEKDLGSWYSGYLKAYRFKLIDKNHWQKQSFDDLTVIDSIKKIFNSNEFTIVPNDEIKAIEEKFYQYKKEYDTFSQLGLEIKHVKDPDLPELKFKSGLNLLDFQKIPVKHMITIPHTANFSIPGTGKTIMTLVAFHILKSQNKVDQMWIIGPIASFKAWEDEYETLFKESKSNHVIRYLGTQIERDRLRNKLGKYDLVITSYNTAANDLELIKRHWKMTNKKIFLILDESHHIKNIQESSENGNPTFSAAMIDLGKFAERRCILSGTPIPRDLEDLWSQITFLWPHIEPFGKREDYLKLLEDFNKEEQIRDIIDFMWTRVTNRELEHEMPKRNIPPTKSIVMDSKQEEIYRIIESQIISELPEGADKEKIKEWKKAMIIRLLQAVTNPKLIVENDEEFRIPQLIIKTEKDKSIRRLIAEYKDNEISPKIKAVAKKARELINDGKNVLIFTVFRGNVTQLEKLLRDEKPLTVTGKDKPTNRENNFEEFKNWDLSSGKGKILIATLGSVAESISLHKNKQGKPVCQNVIYLERNFNGGQYMQSLYRVYRVGSDKTLPITYYFFESRLSDGSTTIDDKVANILETRLNRLYDMLDDEFTMEPISLEESSEEYEENPIDEIYGINESEDEIMAKIENMIKTRKNTS